jgi:hypothetical protein
MNPCEQRFGCTAVLMVGGLLIWIVNFVFVYTFTAVACARGFARLQVAGVGIVPATTVLASVISGFATGWLLRNAIRKRAAADDSERFIRFTTLATGAIALVALVLVTLPPLLIGSCSRS